MPQLLLGLACACGGTEVHSELGAEATKSTFTPRPAGSSASGAGLLPLADLPIDRARSVFSAVRGWPEVRKPAVFVADRDALLRELLAEQDLEMPPEQRRAQNLSLNMLGLVDENFDWDKVMLEALVDNLSGVYLTTKRVILLRAQLDQAASELTLRHELMHAAQDDLYGLGRKVRYADGRGDAIAAVHTLAEGEALALELELDTPLTSADPDVPRQLKLHLERSLAKSAALAPVLRRALMAPYVDGLRVVGAVRKRGGWEAVERLWERGPSSTAELLCEIRRDCGEPAVGFEIPLPSAGEGRQLFSDVMGEQGLRLVLEETEPSDQAEALAANWGDDRLQLRQVEHTLWLFWHIRLRRAEAGRQAGTALGRALAVGDNWVGANACRQLSVGQVRAVMVRPPRDIMVVAARSRPEPSTESLREGCNAAIDAGNRVLDAAELPQHLGR